MSSKIGIFEQIVRYGIGALLIVLAVITLQIPLWFAFVATYPIFTAMVQWDPLYALISIVRQRLAKGMMAPRQAYLSP